MVICGVNFVYQQDSNPTSRYSYLVPPTLGTGSWRSSGLCERQMGPRVRPRGATSCSHIEAGIKTNTWWTRPLRAADLNRLKKFIAVPRAVVQCPSPHMDFLAHPPPGSSRFQGAQTCSPHAQPWAWPPWGIWPQLTHTLSARCFFFLNTFITQC